MNKRPPPCGPTPGGQRQGATLVWRAHPNVRSGWRCFAAGTADLVVAEECTATLTALGFRPRLTADCGVAGVHRLLEHVDSLACADAVVVIAGMEGALASLVGGLTPAPVVAVPTSAGYGASLEGVTALLAMLASCAPGLVRGGHRQRFRCCLGRGPHPRRAPRPTPPGGAGGRPGPERAAPLTTVAWWHCFSGIAGDMALASLLDAGADLDEVTAGLRTLPVRGWHLEAEKTTRGGLAATSLLDRRRSRRRCRRPHVGDHPRPS